MSRLVKLLNHFVFSYSKNPGTYRTCPKSQMIQQRVIALAKLDYYVSLISNDSSRTPGSVNGSSSGSDSYEYCTSYPLDIIIFENERTGPYAISELADGASSAASSSHTLQSRVNDAAVLKPLFRLSRFSRVHGRFVCPVILVHNKNICRSSTLAIQAEAIFNNIHAASKQMLGSLWDFAGFGGGGGGNQTTHATAPVAASSQQQASAVQVGLEGQRAHDIQLLLHTGTSYVADLMVEHRKKKLGVALTSSEKNEQWRYSHLKLNALPYPGCEFFTEYKAAGHSGLNLFFNWSQSFISSDLLLSHPHPMIPDEMLSVNGKPLLPISGRSAGEMEEALAPWFEFQHSHEDHLREHAASRASQQDETATKPSAVSVSPNALTVSSTTAAAAPISASASPPVAVSSIADDLLDELLAHSASGTDTAIMANTFPHDDTMTVGVTTSSDPSSMHMVLTAAAAATSSAAAASSTVNVTAPHPANSVAAALDSIPRASKEVTSFSLYKQWDCVTLTKNYLLILLAHVADETPNSGVLVHCFPADHQLLTDRGFMDLDEVLAAAPYLAPSTPSCRPARAKELLFAAYNPYTKAIAYVPATGLVVKQATKLVEFGGEAAAAQWSVSSDERAQTQSQLNGVSLLVTPEHDMYAQVGQRRSEKDSWKWETASRSKHILPPQKRQAHTLVTADSKAGVRMVAAAANGIGSARRQHVDEAVRTCARPSDRPAAEFLSGALRLLAPRWQDSE